MLPRGSFTHRQPTLTVEVTVKKTIGSSTNLRRDDLRSPRKEERPPAETMKGRQHPTHRKEVTGIKERNASRGQKEEIEKERSSRMRETEDADGKNRMPVGRTAVQGRSRPRLQNKWPSWESLGVPDDNRNKYSLVFLNTSDQVLLIQMNNQFLNKHPDRGINEQEKIAIKKPSVELSKDEKAQMYLGDLATQYDTLKDLILKRYDTQRYRIGEESSPWKRIANAKTCNIKLGDINPLLDRRTGTEIEYEPYKNGRMNKFMKQMMKTLHSQRKDGEKYWKTATRLMSRSISFKLAALNHIQPTWYKSNTAKEVIKTMKEVDEILTGKVKEGDFWRFYVEKANGKLRPIGAPTVPWRIVLHMTNNMLVWFIRDKISVNQHAYQPGKGVGTAWRDILRRSILEKRYVLEFDITGFFDNVDVSESIKLLDEWGVPRNVTSVIKIWHGAKPKRRCWAPVDVYEEEMKERNEKSLKRHFIEWEGMDETTRDLIRGDWVGEEDSAIAFAQGSPLSPTLSTILLQKFLDRQKLNWVAYADDGIIYGDDKFELKDDKELGIKINREKTRWTRENGLWKNSLKFLGIEYIPDKGMRINTRNSGVIELRNDHKETILALRRLFMPELTSSEQIRVKQDQRLKVYADNPWKGYNIAKGIGTFGTQYASKWIHYTKETAKKILGDEAQSEYFDWEWEPKPERGRDLTDLKQLAETGLWDWYFSLGFMEKREQPSGVLEWVNGSMIQKIMKYPRIEEKVKITTQNAGALSNHRMAAILAKNRLIDDLNLGDSFVRNRGKHVGPRLLKWVPNKRRKAKFNTFDSEWVNPTGRSDLWIDLYENLQKAIVGARWTVIGRIQNYFNAKITDPLPKMGELLSKRMHVEEEALNRIKIIVADQQRREERALQKTEKGVESRREQYLFDKLKDGGKVGDYRWRSKSALIWPPRKAKEEKWREMYNSPSFRMLGSMNSKLGKAMFTECSPNLTYIDTEVASGPRWNRSLYQRLKEHGKKYKHITRYLKPERAKPVYLHIAHIR